MSGLRALLAVGSIRTPANPEPSRKLMRSVLDDRALVEGHDPVALYHRVNAALGALGVGRIDSLALLSRAGDGVPPAVAGIGRPVPLVVTPDGVSAPVDGTVALAPKWAVVLGCPSDDAHPHGGLLGVSDVVTALTLFSRPSTPGAPYPARTLLAVTIDG